MESIINIKNGIKEPPRGYGNCKTSQILIFGAIVCQDERRFFAYLSYYLGQNHIDTTTVFV
jgi:hypothetical protein